MNIRIYKYNNYYNRKVKIMTEDSPEFSNFIYATPTTVNWNPNDGVIAEAVFGNAMSSYDGSGDYLVIIDSNNFIASRWFIMDEKREKGGQYTLTLRRDLMADFHDEILNAPMFIEKAILPSSDPFIFNSENMSYNQIKIDEKKLADDTKCSWIVGYYDRKFGEANPSTPNQQNEPFNVEINNEPYYFDTVDSSFKNWKFYKYFDKGNINQMSTYNFIIPFINSYWAYILFSANGVYEDELYFDRQKEGITKTMSEILFNSDTGYNYANNMTDFSNDEDVYEATTQMLSKMKQYGFNNLLNIAKDFFSFETYNEISQLLNYNNKVIKFNSGTTIEYIKLSIGEAYHNTSEETFTTTEYGSLTSRKSFAVDGSLKQTLFDLQKTTTNFDTNYDGYKGAYFTMTYKTRDLSYEKIPFGNYKATFLESGSHLIDAPYDMFCIPYKAVDNEVVTVNGKPLDSEAGFLVAQELIRKYSGGGALYDVQLLPFFPTQNISETTQTGTNLIGLDDGSSVPITYTDPSNNEEEEISRIFFLTNSEFSKTITFNYNISNTKMDSETKMMRLTSPNYNGQFEFNPAKNGGISFFEIECTYKPYTPYIHVNPNFNLLYGQDWNDSRGLICGGDFSLTMMTDNWESYQIQNKNYQNIFDRQIQNLETKNNIQREKDLYGILTGTISGGFKGGSTAAYMSGGNPYAAAAGAVAGTYAGAANGILNYKWNEALRDEGINYRQDLFGYQLGNIQALPQSISKTSAFTYNNKIFPIVEIYDCTDNEKKALANKICYNSMTVMRVGSINEFINNKWSWTSNDNTIFNSKNYIKGQLIRLDTIADNFHITNEIANELNKGVFYENI